MAYRDTIDPAHLLKQIKMKKKKARNFRVSGIERGDEVYFECRCLGNLKLAKFVSSPIC